MRRVALLMLLLAVLSTAAVAAQKERDFAVGTKEALGYQSELPGNASTAKALKQILARPEFNEKQPQPKGPSLLERLLQWIGKHFGGIGAGLVDAGVTTLVIAGVVIAALLVLLIYTVVRAVWGRMSRDEDIALDLPDEALGAAGLRELAKKSAAAGEYQAALRYRFRSVVGGLDVLDTEGQTNWQLLRHVRRQHPTATKDFAALIALFEDCWYGGRKAGAEDYARADALAGAVEKLIMPREEAA